MRARWLSSGSPFGVFTEPKANTTEHVQSKGLETSQVAPNVPQHRPCTQMGEEEAAGEHLSFWTLENRQMHAFNSERGSSLLLLCEHGCVI